MSELLPKSFTDIYLGTLQYTFYEEVQKFLDKKKPVPPYLVDPEKPFGAYCIQVQLCEWLRHYNACLGRTSGFLRPRQEAQRKDPQSARSYQKLAETLWAAVRQALENGNRKKQEEEEDKAEGATQAATA